MNIFVLSNSPTIAAEEHCDKHVVKMMSEYAQLMSTAHRLVDGEYYQGKSKTGRNVKRWRLYDDRETILYQAGFVNHPSAIWCRTNINNYNWLYELYENLHGQFYNRYNKVHKSWSDLHAKLRYPPRNISTDPFTPPPKAMPDECKIGDDSMPNVIASYQFFYHYKKLNGMDVSWKNKKPIWWKFN